MEEPGHNVEDFDFGDDPLQSLQNIASRIGEQDVPESSIQPDEVEENPEPSWGTLAQPEAQEPENPDVFATRSRENKNAEISSELQDMMSSSPPSLHPETTTPEEEEKEGGITKKFFSNLKEGYQLSKEDKDVQKKAEKLNIDTSPRPKNKLQAALGKFSDSPVRSMPLEADPPSSFEQLLVPLKGQEVARVREEALETPTIFDKLEQTRAAASRRQRVGVLFALAIVTTFMGLVGGQYLTETLPGIATPSWVPTWVPDKASGAVIFGLGLLAPLLSVFIFSESIRLLLAAAADRDLFDLALGSSAMILGIMSLVCLVTGNIAWALLFLALYAIADRIVEAIRDRWKI